MPNLPSIPGLGGIDSKLAKILAPIKEILENVITVDDDGNVAVAGTDGSDGAPGPPGPPGEDGNNGTGYDPTTDPTTPPIPAELTATGLTYAIVLQWNHNPITNYDYTQIYRNPSVNDIAHVGTLEWARASGTIYQDDSITIDQEYYYWIKFVSMAGLESPIYPTTSIGVTGKASKIESTVIGDDSISTPHLAAGAITADKAVIGDAVIVEAMIGIGQVTNAKISDYIQSNTFNPSLGYGWRIDKTGAAVFSQIQIFDNYGNAILTSGPSDGEVTFGNVIGNQYVSVGANQIFNSQMYPHDSGWTGYTGGGALNSSYTHRSREWVHDGGLNISWAIYPGVAEVYQSTNSPTGYYDVTSEPYYGVDATKRYQLSARTGAHRCTVVVFINCFNSNKQWIGTAGPSSINANDKQGGNALDGSGTTGDGWYEHDIHSGPLPAGTAYIRPMFRKYGTSTGADSYMFVTHAFLAVTNNDPLDNVYLPYNVGPENIGIYNPITFENIGTYIDTAAISNAYINDLRAEKITGDIIKEQQDSIAYKLLEYDSQGQLYLPSDGVSYWTGATVFIPSEFLDRTIYFPIPPTFDLAYKRDRIGDANGEAYAVALYVQTKINGVPIGPISSQGYTGTYAYGTGGQTVTYSIDAPSVGIDLAYDYDNNVSFSVRASVFGPVDTATLSTRAKTVRAQIMKKSTGALVQWS